MPKTTGMFKTAEQMDEMERRASGSLQKYMTINNISDEYLAKKLAVSTKTVQNRVRNPGSISLRELWRMAIIIKCPIGEIAGGPDASELLGKLLYEEMKKERT